MNSILDRNTINSWNLGTLSPFAERVDGLVTRFVEEAASPTTLGALMVGGMAYRFGKIGVMAAGSGHVTAMPLRLLSYGIGLGSEVTAFEFTNRALSTFRAHGRAPLQENPNLWSWSGPGGWREGLFNSAITFGMLKSAGSLAREENLVFQHAFQSSAMVAGHQVSAEIGLTTKPQEGLPEQFLHAEITNLQMSAGMGLAYRMAPGLQAMEQGLDLSLQGHEIFNVRAHGRAPVFAVASSLADSEINLHTQEMGLPTRFKQGILQTSGSGESGSAKTKKSNPATKTTSPEDTKQDLTPEKIHLVALGDIHSQWGDVQKILDHEFPEGNGTAIAVGDLETYPPLARGHQIHFIHGNHDDFPLLKKMRAGEIPSNQNYHPLFPGDLIRLGELTVAGLPGNFSPKFFENPRKSPLKHFLPLHFEKAKSIQSPIDIFLLHEAPKDVGFRKGGSDLGISFLTGLIEYLQPRLVFFGHHHRRFEGRIGETRIVGLDHPGRSYVTLDYDPRTDHLELGEQVAKGIDPSRRLFQFSWEEGKKEESRSLFGGGIPLEKEKRIMELLETRHRANVIDSLEKILMTETEGKDAEEKAFRARTRAALAANEALPFVAKYAARLEADPELSMEERKKILGEIFEAMTPNSAPTEITDDVRAFGEFLKALKISKP